MDFNDLLSTRGIDTKKSRTLVMRHTPTQPRLRKALPWLVGHKPDVFNAYQQSQKPVAEKQLTRAAYLASFIGHKSGEALFAGLYEVTSYRPISYHEMWSIPGNEELQKLGMIAGAESAYRPTTLWFELRLTDILADLKGKLIISWPPSAKAFARWVDQNEFKVRPKLEESAFDKAMPPSDKPVLRPKRDVSISNPDWTRDELILALNAYLKHRPNPPGKGSLEITELSRMLNQLGDKLFPPETRAETFRNENGVYMKLMNFRRLDPQYTSEGKKGLSRGAKAEEEVWEEYSGDAARCLHVAEAIMASLNDPEVSANWPELDDDEGIQEAAEGRLLTRKHFARERNRKLVESKRKQAIKRHGKLSCEVCNFDFAISYGSRGDGFIECHHTKPVATLAEGHKTHIDDLALVCANCHRIIHRGKPWLSVEGLKVLMNEARL